MFVDNGASSYRRFLEGDDNGIIEIVTEYKDSLILYLNSYVNNIYIAEELMEDTFFKLIVKKPMFFNRYSFKTWLYTIGRNLAIDYLRRQTKTVNQPIEDYTQLLVDEKKLEEDYFREERRLIVQQAMKKLKKEYREVLYLSYFEQLKNVEIGKVMHKNKSQIEMLLYRAKKSLRAILEKEGFEYEEL